MRTLIKLLMLFATIALIGINLLSFFATSQAVQSTAAGNDPKLTETYNNKKSNLDAIVADRSLEKRANPNTFKQEWVSRDSGKADDEANALEIEVDDLASKVVAQSAKTVGAAAGAGIFAGGMLCVSIGAYVVVMLILFVLYFVFKPNTATIMVRHLP